jgi:hypothetical protein
MKFTAHRGMPASLGEYSHRTIEGSIGHNLPQEAPDAFSDAVLELGAAQ